MRAPAVLAAALLAASAAAAGEKLPAFPGAEGFGAATAGGRGGKVVHVTSLEDSGPGSFRAALAGKGPRIVVFDVGGSIELKSNVSIPTGEGRITIAGQTAPGGITLIGATLGLPGWSRRGVTTDVICRHIRVRGVHNTARPGQGGDCLNVFRAKRVIIDHCSFAGSMDETVDSIVSTELTYQWCTIEASALWGQGGNQHDEGDHNLGMIFGYNDDTVATIHHSLFAHHKYRMPLFAKGRIIDHRNNISYNWYRHSGSYKGSVGSNAVGNSYVMGPNTDKPHVFGGTQGAGVYFHDNQLLPKLPAPAEQKAILDLCYRAERTKILEKPVEAPAVATQECRKACEAVLAKAGAWPRDLTTRRTVEEVRSRKGKYGLYGPYERFAARGDGPTSLKFDTDRDGMPDAWEAARGLDPKDPADGRKTVPKGASEGDRHAGYTYVEFYLNGLADSIVGAEAETAKVELEVKGAGRVVCVHSGRTPRWHPKKDKVRGGPKEVDWGTGHVVNAGSELRMKALPGRSAFTGWWVGGEKKSAETVFTLAVRKDTKVEARFSAEGEGDK